MKKTSLPLKEEDEAAFGHKHSRDRETSGAKPAFDVIPCRSSFSKSIQMQSSCHHKLHFGLPFALNHASALCRG